MKRNFLIGLLLLSSMTECNLQKEEKETNPLLAEWNTPHQTPPFQLIKHEHFIPAIEQALKDGKNEVNAIINCPDKPTFENTIVALEVSI